VPAVLAEVLSTIDSAVRPALEHWLNHNRSVAEAHMSLAAQTKALRTLLDQAGWLP